MGPDSRRQFPFCCCSQIVEQAHARDISLSGALLSGVDADLRRNLLEYYGNDTPADAATAEALALLRM